MLVFQRYKSYSPYDMQESIVKEVKGDLQKSFLVLGKYSQSVIPAVNSLINMNSFSQANTCILLPEVKSSARYKTYY